MTITVNRKGKNFKFTLKEKESLMDGLLREGFYLSAVCGGRGRCGKCKVQVLHGRALVTSEDEKFFTTLELEAGWRLSCLLIPTEDLTVSFEQNDESEFEAVSGFERGNESVESQSGEDRELSVAIDIGTTTIALQLLNGSGEVLNTVTSINSQRKYGADVISRIQASVDGRMEELQSCIRKDLQAGVSSLLDSCGKSLELVKRVTIACNTTMSHLLMGYNCKGLGLYPFTPVNIDFIQGTVSEIIGLQSEAVVMILPGISTYVGSDIVSGLYACEFDKTKEICLLVDLGTNGEMALGNCEKLLVTSTAAGPAFEGGNLSWGMGSVAGAICSVQLETEPKGIPSAHDDIQVHIETIRNKSPLGVCGTGVVEAIAEMLRTGIVDEMGLMDETYFESGFPLAITESGEQIVITQKDIRELQLAKAAIRAGIETLLLRYGITKEQVSKVYLAGGFGYRLNVEKAMAIGMLPEEFAGRVLAVGNSSLAGAVKFTKNMQEEILQRIVKSSEGIELSMDEDFNHFYMEYMLFE